MPEVTSFAGVLAAAMHILGVGGAAAIARPAPANKSTSAPPSTMASFAHCYYVIRYWLLLKLFDWFLLVNWTNTIKYRFESFGES